MVQTRSRAELLVLSLCVTGLVASLLVLVHPWFDPVRDAATYIALAHSLAAGEGYQYLGIPMILRPPGFPLFLAPIVASLGTHFQALNLLVALFGAAGVVLLYLHERPRLGFAAALLVAIALWLNPGYQRYCNQVMSDVPGTTLVIACLLIERWAARAPSRRRELVLGLCIGVAAYVRSIALLLVPAVIAARLVDRLLRADDGSPWPRFARERLALFALVTGLVLAPWSVRNAQVAPPPPADQLDLYSYSAGLWHRDRGDPSSPRVDVEDVLARAPVRMRQIADVLGSRMRTALREDERPAAVRPGRAAVALLLVAGLLASLVRRRAPADFFALGTLVVVLFYFGFNTRLLVPVYALALPSAAALVRTLAQPALGARGAGLLVGAALVLLIAADFEPRRDWDAIRAHHDEFARRARVIDAALKPETRLASDMGFYYGLYLQRPVYSLSMAIRRRDDPAAADQIIDAYGLEAVVLTGATPAERRLARHLTRRYGAPWTAGRVHFWDVRPRQPAEGPR